MLGAEKQSFSIKWIGTGRKMKSANDPIYVEFIAKLRACRRDKNLTQAELAEILNRPQSYVSKVETCERRIDVIETFFWCSALGVEISSVLPRSLVPVRTVS